MLRIVATVLLAVLLAPSASAGPLADAGRDARAACDGFPSPPQNVCSLVATPLWRAANISEEWTAAPEEAVDALEVQTCGYPPYYYGQNSLQCRLISGRPIAGGAFDLCASSPQPYNLLSTILWTGAQTVDRELRRQTEHFLWGTPAEGEGLCHDHWQTLYDVALLV